MPTTTWPGTVFAMSSAASSARLHDWMTDSRSAIAPPDMAAGPCGSLPTPSTSPSGPSRRTTRTLIRSVPMSSTVKWR
ncbi:MAG: hypothetical protein E6I29_01775 [Chloroflexi bacterium]|nr:MAG: hypothetical protein E6I29_01775 [Chloroflexota bacterium]